MEGPLVGAMVGVSEIKVSVGCTSLVVFVVLLCVYAALLIDPQSNSKPTITPMTIHTVFFFFGGGGGGIIGGGIC